MWELTLKGYRFPTEHFKISQQPWIDTFYPTGPFTILEPKDQEIGELYAVQKRPKADFEAPRL